MAMANQISTDKLRKQGGFTLVELLIAMAVGGVVMAAVMTSFMSQHETYLAQDEVVEMQQNTRVALDMLSRDIRSIGYDPVRLGAGLTTTGIHDDNGTAATLAFTRDDGTGKLETIEYSLIDAFASASPPRNDGRVDDLAREETKAGKPSSGRQPVAENVSLLEFRYLDASGYPTSKTNNVHAIQVSMMVQAANPATKSPPAQQTYTTPSGAVWTSDNSYRSMFLTTTIHCRNLGF